MAKNKTSVKTYAPDGAKSSKTPIAKIVLRKMPADDIGAAFDKLMKRAREENAEISSARLTATLF